MNRFQIALGKENQFEEIWVKRQSNLKEVPGFREFHLLRGPQGEDHVLYATHVIWETEQNFQDWTTSAHFRKSHSRAGGSKDLYLGPPRFEGFSAVLIQGA